MSAELLMWLLPTGWLAALAQWWVQRKRLKTQMLKESNDDLLSMARASRAELANVHTEIIELYEKLRIYNQAMAAAGTCGNGLDCPVIAKLQEQGICHRFIGQSDSFGNQSAADHD